MLISDHLSKNIVASFYFSFIIMALMKSTNTKVKFYISCTETRSLFIETRSKAKSDSMSASNAASGASAQGASSEREARNETIYSSPAKMVWSSTNESSVEQK